MDVLGLIKFVWVLCGSELLVLAMAWLYMVSEPNLPVELIFAMSKNCCPLLAHGCWILDYYRITSNLMDTRKIIILANVRYN